MIVYSINRVITLFVKYTVNWITDPLIIQENLNIVKSTEDKSI